MHENRLGQYHLFRKVKKEFKDRCSVQVYSVQTCIPKDLAVLWSAEFVQAEQLFGQPSTTENCLRDNRFCGVSNSYVKRTVDGKSVSAVSQLKNDTKISVKPKANSILKDSTSQPPQGPVAESSMKHGIQPSFIGSAGVKDERTAPVMDQSAKPHLAKESTPTVHTTKKKVQNEKTSSGNGGSLASLWGRASEKPKPSNPAVSTTIDVTNASFSAEAQISVHEAADVLSSDDDGPGFNHKRELNGASNRKRRVLMDFSDDDEDENVANLASPGPPYVHTFSDSLHDEGKLIMEKKNPSFEHHKEDKSEVKQEKLEEGDSRLSTENVLRGGNNKNITGINLQKKPQIDTPKEHADTIGHKSGTDKIATSASSSPKRRKVLKTRTDERGREVTEVVWEDEAGTEKNMKNNDVGNRPTVENKAPAAGTNTSTNPASKPGNKKPAKGGGKDAKQGNILSFFKKV
ncbi:uncharacterized protein M6B38_251570 [Iris pallida]|uniref:DNA polymerase delta subunit 3 n=1 Tax=Iris pallida TaxID=29817 RepID=A0AAX6IJH9_IRIPA|nr:uncharacterized protein M6B38_251570 [Iris pallida]